VPDALTKMVNEAHDDGVADEEAAKNASEAVTRILQG
jgi:hypothetical protein